MAASPVAGRYDTAVDPESAHEILAARAEASASEAALAEEMLAQSKADKEAGQGRRYEHQRTAASKPSLGSELARSAIKQLNSREGQKLVRGILGSLFKGR
jgi:hypothetical protein